MDLHGPVMGDSRSPSSPTLGNQRQHDLARHAEALVRTYTSIQGLQEKGLQSRSATASLLIKNYQCMKEEI